MSKKNYNWWGDPKNKKEVERISWWNHPENKEDYMLPISVIESDGVWVATCNDETELVLGKRLHGCAQGDTKSDAIEKMFEIIRFSHEYSERQVMKYQRWVPFRSGKWEGIGTHWLVIFGLHFYFRSGKNMKGGWYIPLTNFNISFHNEWLSYRKNKLSKWKDW